MFFLFSFFVEKVKKIRLLGLYWRRLETHPQNCYHNLTGATGAFSFPGA
ncbi:hypothetical protein BC792_11372 [Sphingobacterium allocomposti]|uniref:Uncharacterized protein n=1 Tax=Sphingobacterium allocomposti TaxID=415956 RepID=A0A5S5DF52_9SPHI|nr:hypothetical protein BC792_11372 [Sphingobacterium composti Yoo et al. 2007 non Ten et al. 2007]